MGVEWRQLRDELLSDMNRTMRGSEYLCVLYGSQREEYDSSTDVDICIYSEQMTDEQQNEIAGAVERLHRVHNLKIDCDMPYKNKTWFCKKDLESLKQAPPFPVKDDGCISLQPVKPNRNFLDSPQMRLRLLLNIFTTNCVLVYGCKEFFEKIVTEMYQILLKYVLRSSKHEMSFHDIFNCLFTDSKRVYTYKSFLGYDPSDQVQLLYMEERLREALERAVKEGVVKTCGHRFYLAERQPKEKMCRIVYITGASGVGTTSLGRLIQAEFDVNLIESDEITMYPTNPPFQYPRPQEQRLPMLKERLSKDKVNVIVGSINDWGLDVISRAAIFILLYAPFQTRWGRIKEREQARFGQRLLTDEIVKRNYERLLKWTAQYDQFDDARSWKAHYGLYQQFQGKKYLFSGAAETSQEIFESVKLDIEELFE